MNQCSYDVGIMSALIWTSLTHTFCV